MASDAEGTPSRSTGDPIIAPRAPLRDQVRDVLLERLINAELPAGERINESTLAAELGVSRTPLREALLQLQREGFITTEMGKGFRVRDMSVRELRQVSPINAALEALAVRTSGPDIADGLDELARLDEQIDRSLAEPLRVYELNRRWHVVLTRRCPNAELLKILRGVRERCYRYQRFYYVQNVGRPEGPVPAHILVRDAIAAGDIDRAATITADNENGAGQRLARWLLEHRGEAAEH